MIALSAPLSAAPAAPAIPESEESDIATLPAMQPHWVMLMDGWRLKGTRIIDGDSGKILGTVHTRELSAVRLAPDNSFIYVAETIWTRGNRGKRQDLLTVYDARSLKIVAEIDLPGRLLVGGRQHTLSLSGDGRLAYVYNMDPASSVIVVDLQTRTVLRTIETPGCALALAGAGDRIGSLCGDGSLSVVSASGQGAGSAAKPFFQAEEDPIFDNSIVDTRTGNAVLLSYSGLIYAAKLDGTPVAKPWSLQEAAGLPRTTTAPLIPSWLPGGDQLMAWHRASGQLYVLMHLGEFWSHKEDGEEIWVVDVARRKVLARHRVTDKVANIQVSQDDQPLLYLSGANTLRILDARTFEEKKSITGVGNGIMTVPGG